MSKGSKVILIALGILLIITISASFYRFMVLHDYVIEAEVDCDPTFESCFVWQCDENVEACTGNPEEDIWYFKYAYRNAQNIPQCAEEEACEQFMCEIDEIDCREVQCNENSLVAYDFEGPCANPESEQTIDVNPEEV